MKKKAEKKPKSKKIALKDLKKFSAGKPTSCGGSTIERMLKASGYSGGMG
jgi:hypothetical protein